jgi:hypothetical protein
LGKNKLVRVVKALVAVAAEVEENSGITLRKK